MVSFRSLLATVPLVASAIAQIPNIAFSSVPAVVIAGQSYNISWGGGDGTGVTITLRRGNPANLATIGILVDQAPGYSWLWDVSTDLPTASDYALQIVQGQSDINYSGLFSLVGGTGTSSISFAGYTSTSRAANSSTSATHTMTSAIASAGTGTAISRNTTFSTASLTKTETATSTASTSTVSGTRTTASGTASNTAAPNTNIATQMGSSAALVMGLFAAVMFLG